LIASPSDCRKGIGTKPYSRYNKPSYCPKSVSNFENVNCPSISPAIIKSQSKLNVLSLPTIIESNESTAHTDALPVKNSDPVIITASKNSSDMNKESIPEIPLPIKSDVVDENKSDHKSTISMLPPNISKSLTPAVHVNERNSQLSADAKAFIPSTVSKVRNSDVPCSSTSNVDRHDIVIHGISGRSAWVILTVNGERCNALIDSGSALTIFKSSFGNQVESSDHSVRSATGHKLHKMCSSMIDFEISNFKVHGHKVYVWDGLENPIIGYDILKAYGAVIDLKKMILTLNDHDIPLYTYFEIELIDNVVNALTSENRFPVPDTVISQIIKLPVEYRQQATNMFKEFSELFRTDILGTSKRFQHEIHLSDKTPVRLMPYRLSPAQYPKVQEKIQEMLDKGVIRPSKSSYSSPVVIVNKKDNSIRLCLDYRQLYQKTIPNSFPLPRIQEILDALQGARYFATLDLSNGFWQIPMRECDIPLTAFTVQNGHYECLKMPQGQRNATATFSRCMVELLKPMLNAGVLVFVDDLTIYGKSIPELLERVYKVFEIIKSDNLTLNPKKCIFFETEVTVLGHRVSHEGTKPMNDKIKAIEEWKEPTTRKGVRSFLGLAGYYRQYVLNFAKIAAPLHKLTGKATRWQWTEREQKSFHDLKQILKEAPVLKIFDPNRPIIIDTDASNHAIGAVLVQTDEDGNEHPIAYYSRCLSKAECNYCVTRRELLIIVCALRHWRHYIMGTKIVVRSDHSSLSWIRSFKNPEQQMARWMEIICQYDIDIQHRPGSKSGNADGLSRRPCPEGCTYCSRREEREKVSQVLMIRIDSEVNWIIEQAKDEDLVKVIQWKKDDLKPPWESVSGGSPSLKRLWREYSCLVLQEDILKRTYYKAVGQIFQILVPRQCRADIVKQIHEQGHFGCLRTQNSLRDRFYWPSWKTDISKHVGRCVPCLQRKGPQVRPKLPPKKYLSSEPFERLSMDITGPLNVTARGNKYILVVTDYFTKWCEAIPIPDQQATTIADALIEVVISRHGCPREIHSDRGQNFLSQVIKLICDRLHITRTKTCAYRPCSNGITERNNRTIADCLSKLSEENREWDRLVPLVCLYMRSSQHKVTGYSPALLTYGREMRLPADLMYPTGHVDTTITMPEYLENLEQRLHVASEMARKHLEMDWQGRESNAQFWQNYRDLDINKPVFVFRPVVGKGRFAKLAKHWHGPYKIIEIINPYLYKVRMGKRNEICVVHRCHLFQPVHIEENEVRQTRVCQ
jgi:transposase InsO family protein